MTVRDFMAALRRRWRIVAAAVLLAVGLSALVTLRTPSIYSATARVYLAAEGVTSENGAQRQGTFVLTSQDLNTYAQVMVSPEVQQQLQAKLNVPAGTFVSVSGVVLEQAPMLDLTGVSNDPQLAADAANAMGPVLASLAPKYSPLLQVAGQQVVSTQISPAGAPSRPDSPNVVLNLVMGFLTGLLVGIGVALIRQFLDTKVHVDADLTALSDKAILAHIPLDKAAKGRGVAMLSDPHGVTAEAVRRLRTNLMFVDVTTGRHSFVITSPMAGEGKTTTSLNLALAIAHAGSRVLLVDGDLRHPSVARALGLDADIGLTTLLLGQIDVDEAIQPLGSAGLDVLGAGPIPPNPSELLSSMPMELLFHELKSRYDMIIVDSPPIVPVVDAMLLERLAGGLLLVVAADRTAKRDLATALKALETAGATLSGFAMNFATGDAARPYAYGYHRQMTAAAEAASITTGRLRTRSEANPAEQVGPGRR